MKVTKRALMLGNALIRRWVFKRAGCVRAIFAVDVTADGSMQSYFEWNTVLFRVILPRYLRPGIRVLDMGTGSHGLLAIAAKKVRGDVHVTATDIVPDRITHARATAERNHVDLDFRVASLFDGVDGKFDLILFAPPIIPTRELGELGYDWKELPGLGSRRCWSSDGGVDGMQVLEPFLRHLDDHLSDDGVALMTINPSHCPDEIIRTLCGQSDLRVQHVHRIPGIVCAYVLQGGSACPAH